MFYLYNLFSCGVLLSMHYALTSSRHPWWRTTLIQIHLMNIRFQTWLDFTFTIYNPIPEKEPTYSEWSDRKEKKNFSWEGV